MVPGPRNQPAGPRRSLTGVVRAESMARVVINQPVRADRGDPARLLTGGIVWIGGIVRTGRRAGSRQHRQAGDGPAGARPVGDEDGEAGPPAGPCRGTLISGDLLLHGAR